MQRPARNEIPQLKLSAKTPTYSPLKNIRVRGIERISPSPSPELAALSKTRDPYAGELPRSSLGYLIHFPSR